MGTKNYTITSGKNKVSVHQYGIKWEDAYLFNNQGFLVQAMAPLSLEASDARVALLNILQAKFHSSTPPYAMALQ